MLWVNSFVILHQVTEPLLALSAEEYKVNVIPTIIGWIAGGIK